MSKEAAQVETDAKGSWHNGIAEAWSGWSPIVTGLKEYAEAMEAGGKPKPCGVTTRPDGQMVVDVGPAGYASWAGSCVGAYPGCAWVGKWSVLVSGQGFAHVMAKMRR